jgi:hypothetical protein
MTLATRGRTNTDYAIAAGITLCLAGLALAAWRKAPANHGPAYLPLDTPKPVAENIWVVDSLLPGAIGDVVPCRMTVLRLSDGSLLLYSPTQFSYPLKAALEELGEIRHLVAPNMAHWLFLKSWQQACRDATTWAARGLRGRSQVRQSGLRLDHDLRDHAPDEWGEGITLISVPGALDFHEAALYHEPSGTLLLADLAMNLEPSKTPLPLRPALWVLGLLRGLPPPWLRAIVRLKGHEAEDAAAQIAALRPQRVLFAHGAWEGARPSYLLRWLLPS